ncbi:MAG: hypothetical protein KDD33_09315 [Bdellovibrionales bacterium]|nr:hypothetical protein [Bdellovibrionales bacterium]
MKSLLFFTLMIPCLVFAKEKQTSKGELFDLDGKTKRFSYERFHDEGAEQQTDRSLYKDLQGDVMVEEKLITKNGEFVSYAIDHKQTGEKGLVEKRGDKIFFQKTKSDGKVDTDTESYPSHFMVGMQIVSYMRQHWDALKGGKKVEIRLGVWSRTETIGFRLRKGDSKAGEFVVVMEPSSFFIRSLVDPLHFYFDPSDKRLVKITGRTQPKIKKDGKWKDFDALSKYYPVQ